jgi:hypothetical protein
MHLALGVIGKSGVSTFYIHYASELLRENIISAKSRTRRLSSHPITAVYVRTPTSTWVDKKPSVPLSNGITTLATNKENIITEVPMAADE